MSDFQNYGPPAESPKYWVPYYTKDPKRDQPSKGLGVSALLWELWFGLLGGSCDLVPIHNWAYSPTSSPLSVVAPTIATYPEHLHTSTREP